MADESCHASGSGGHVPVESLPGSMPDQLEVGGRMEGGRREGGGRVTRWNTLHLQVACLLRREVGDKGRCGALPSIVSQHLRPAHLQRW